MFTAAKAKLPKALVWPWKWTPLNIPEVKFSLSWKMPRKLVALPPNKALLDHQVRQAELQMISQMRRWG